MAKVLYVQASPRKERSKSSQVAAVFLDAYQKANPDDRIDSLNVFEEDLPSFDGLTIQAKYTILHGKEHTTEERQAWDTVEQVIDRFKQADKYVFSLPMWNFGIPYKLKQYIDILVQPGYTFSYGESGYQGLITGKPVTVIYARGGTYAEGTGAEAYDLQRQYMDLFLGFIGFEDIRTILVEPTLQGDPNNIQKKIDASMETAQMLAREF